jgi:hypothetical protein
MLLRSSIIAGATALALVGFAQAAGSADMPSAQTTTAPAPTSTTPPPADATVAPAPAAGINLNDVQSPKTTLKGAAVKDSKGDAIGEVKSVQLDAAGKVAAVNVSIGGKDVALKANTLTYMQAENTLVSTQSKAEIAAP